MFHRAASMANPSAEPTPSTPTSVTQTISTLRLQHAKLLEEFGTLASQLKIRTSELSTTRERLHTVEANLTSMKRKLTDAEDQVDRYKRKAEFSEMEGKGLRAILETYEVEERNHSGEILSAAYDGQKGERISFLEGQVEELKGTVEDLEKMLDERGGPNEVSPRELAAALDESRNRIVELEEGLLSYPFRPSGKTDSYVSRPRGVSTKRGRPS